jgi:RNA polymerase sigma factor (sigma-70 family)
MSSDKKIWDDFRNGESYATSHIYYQHVQLLFRYGKKFSKDDELIKDTIQDLFLDLIRTKNKLGETDNISFYLLRSFRRKLVRNIQKQNLTIDSTGNKLIEAEIVYSAEKELIEKEELTYREKIVKKALSELSNKQREIFFYRFTCNYDYEQICEIMSLKYDSARKLVSRALKSLKEGLLEEKKRKKFFLYN